MQVISQLKTKFGHGFLAVNLLINSKSRKTGITRNHFCGTACRCQQYGFLFQFVQRTYQSTHHRCFTRSGIPTQQKCLFAIGGH